MQSVILDRCKQGRTRTGPACADPSVWQVLLADFDAAVAALRRAYTAYQQSVPLVRAITPTPAGQDFYVVTLPQLEAAIQHLVVALQQALNVWLEVTTRYVLLLEGKPVSLTPYQRPAA